MENVKITEFIEGGNGKTCAKYIEWSSFYYNMVNDLIANSYYFSMETLNTGEIVLYCESFDNDEDMMLEIVKNKKDVSATLELLIDECYNRFLGDRNSK